MSAAATLAPDAAMVLGIASAAMPFARTPRDEAERWLRVLRLHGEVGVALRALGVSEGPLDPPRERADHERLAAPGGEERNVPGGEQRDAVQDVSEHALQIAVRRGAAGIATTDLLMAVMQVYGEEFDRVLHAHGTDRDEVLARLGATVK